MQTFLHGRDLIGDLDFSKEEVETVLDVAFDLKRKRALNEPHAYLRDKVLAMLFFFSSTRTRGSFEAGMAQLGGHAAFIESRTTQISHGDTAKEIGEIFGRYFDGMAIRHVDWGSRQRLPQRRGQEFARAGAEHAVRYLPSLPVPGRPDDDHREKRPRPAPQEDGRLVGLCRLLPETDVGAAILILQMPRFGLDVVLAHPPEFKLMPEIMDQAREQARKFGTGFEVTDDMEQAFKDADIVYAKSWGAMVHTPDEKEGAEIIQKYSQLDHRRAPDGAGQRGCHLHAPAARRPQHRSHRRGDRRPAIRWFTMKPRTACTSRKP